MAKNPHAVLTASEARSQLPAIIGRFRAAGPDADPVLIGAPGRPQAVVLSYESYIKLISGRDRVSLFLDRQAAKIRAGLGDDEAMKLANRELRAMRRERCRPDVMG